VICQNGQSNRAPVRKPMLPDHLSKATLGYVIHTNRELGLMLSRTKPLAVFSELDGNFVAPVRRYMRMFDRHVRAGTFVKREHIEMRPATAAEASRNLHLVLFALPEEAWRINAMIDLRRNLSAWTAEHERKEGMLLGYTEAQNETWIATRYRQPRPAGDPLHGPTAPKTSAK
jgi:hypothetical protein